MTSGVAGVDGDDDDAGGGHEEEQVQHHQRRQRDALVDVERVAARNSSTSASSWVIW